MNAEKRYASSLLQLAVERNEVEVVYEDMQSVSLTLKESRDLRLALKSPVITVTAKSTIIRSLFFNKVCTTTQAFIDMLLKKSRIDLLAQIAEKYTQLYHDYAGIIEVEVTTTEALSKEQEANLVHSLHTSTGKKILLKPLIDPAIIGGIKARIDDTVIDGSIQYKLQTLRKSLIQQG